MCERQYSKIRIVTNDYGFLFKFAFETDAFIEVLDYEDICDTFNLCYADPDLAEMSQEVLASVLQGN